MKALTVCEPMASAIIHGDKDVENRRKSMGIRGATLICAGLSRAWYQTDVTAWLNERWSVCPANPIAALEKFGWNHGYALGVAYFGDPYKIAIDGPKGLPLREATRYATGPVCYPVLAKAALTVPFRVRGHQGVFTLAAELCTAEAHDLADQVREEGRKFEVRR